MEISCSDHKIIVDGVEDNDMIHFCFRVNFNGDFNPNVVYGLLLEIFFFDELDETNRRISFIVGNKVSENGQMVVPAFCLKHKEKIPDVNFGLENGFHPICVPVWGNGKYMVNLRIASFGLQEEIKIFDGYRRFTVTITKSIYHRPIYSASEVFIRSLRPDFPIKDEKPKKNEKLKESQGGRESQGKETFIADELTKDITEEEFQEGGIRQRKNK